MSDNGQPIDDTEHVDEVAEEPVRGDNAKYAVADRMSEDTAAGNIKEAMARRTDEDASENQTSISVQQDLAPDIAKQAEEYLHGWRRAKADYENLKKEVERERREMGVFARTMTAMDFIPIYDNFKKAAQHEPQLSDTEESKRFKQWVDGIQHIKSQFKEVLKQIGIEEIPTVGAKFDPRVHEAVEEREGSGASVGQIIAEVNGGYKMGERVLQAAKVIIAK